ncbi:MAG: hypothetical protein M8357_03845 [Desulfobulbaceae bacterium]|nr:hypothetical protein [Desulfobulbaceae bacterium]
MFYRPELMVYLWMLPVAGMVVVPVLWAMTRLLYQKFERSRLGDVRGFIDLNGAGPADRENRERRSDPRVSIEGCRANVARQVRCCRAQVANISPRGICFTNIPGQMCHEEDGKLKVVLRTRERDYTMQVRPRWRKLHEKGYMIGAEIVRVPAGWHYFVNDLSRLAMARAA